YIDIPQPLLERQRGRGMPLPVPAAAPSAPREESFGIENEVMQQQFIAAEIVTAEVAKQGNVVTFILNRGGNIPSDGKPHKTTIFQDDFPCKLNYIAMPKLVSFAYLQANIQNSPNGATLLPGKANIFRDDIFVGKIQLENIAPGQEFKLNLGIDEGLKIERDLAERQVDKKFMGNQRKITFAYRIVITNLLDYAANLKVTDQLPVSRNEQIKVKLTRSTPQIQLGEMGILEWDLTIQSEGKQEIYYQFTVEHPPELQIVGLDI
ncbi:MAG TPA: mucoidy inhibitor MuiA family protein, partial [Nostocaceae cyanobacterium]|nr:mucoidy inhibitor MuiA family protein [Nostocaceae cyanobacterium]